VSAILAPGAYPVSLFSCVHCGFMWTLWLCGEVPHMGGVVDNTRQTDKTSHAWSRDTTTNETQTTCNAPVHPSLPESLA
jgi:hypothetical protein